MLAACSSATQDAPQPSISSTTPTTTSSTSTDKTDLPTSEGLTIFDKAAGEYPAQIDSSRFEIADFNSHKKSDILMEAPSDGKCYDLVDPSGRVDDTTLLATLTPAKVRCEYDGGEELPASTLMGIQKDGEFVPFSSTAKLVPHDTPRQVYDMTSDGTTAYWFETASTSLSHDEWRLFAADLKTGDSRLLLTAEDGLDLAGPLPVSAKTNLTFHEGRLYFIGYYPTEQYFEKVDSQNVDPEGWEPGDFVQGVLSVKTDGTDLAIAGESIFDFGFTESKIAYVKLVDVTRSYLTPEGTRESTEAAYPKRIVVAAGGVEEVLVEDVGSSDGTFHSEIAITNFQTDDRFISFSRGLTAYLLDVQSQEVDIVDLASTINLIAENTSDIEPSARITDLIYSDGQFAMIVNSEDTEEVENFVVVYDLGDKTGKIFPTDSNPYMLGVDRNEFTFRLDTGEIATYTIPPM